MILSDRVSGKVSRWGVLAAIVFALAALPGWSRGQQKPAPDEPKIDASKAKEADESFPEKWKDVLKKHLPASCLKNLPANTAMSWKTCMSCHSTLKEGDKARFTNEMKRVEEFQIPLIPLPSRRPWVAELLPMMPADFAKNQKVAKPDQFPLVFKGNGRSYYLTADDKGAYLGARNADGREMWHHMISEKLPVAAGGGEWRLAEPTDKKEVVLTWNRDDQTMTFYLETNTGKMLRQEIMPPEPKTRSNKNAAPPSKANESDEDRLKRLEKEIQDLRQKLQKQGAGSLPPLPSADGKLVLEASGKEVQVIDAASGKIVRTIQPDGATGIVGQHFATDGKTIVVSDAQGLVWEIDLATGKILKKMQSGIRRFSDPKTGNAVGQNSGPSVPAHFAPAVDKAKADLYAAKARLDKLRDVGVSKSEGDAAAADVSKATERLKLLLDQSKSDQAAMEAQRNLAIADYQRAMKLYNDKAISRQEFDDLKKRYMDADRRLNDMQPGANTPLPRGSHSVGTDVSFTDMKARPAASARDPLDLAERYLKAVADLKLARSQLAGMEKETGAYSRFDIEKAKIEFERAERVEQLMSAYIKDALKLAAAAKAAAEQDLARLKQMVDKGHVARSEFDAAQVRCDEAATNLKQLESIVSLFSAPRK